MHTSNAENMTAEAATTMLLRNQAAGMTTALG
jgi:hypothetical protein